MSYANGFAELASATARLLAAGPPDPGDLLAAGQVAVTLAARDIVVGQVRALTGALLVAGPVSGADLRPAHLVADPAHVLYEALGGLPAVAPERLAPSETLTGAGEWVAAGRAALSLERYLQPAGELGGVAAWSAVRDVAEVAAAVAVLDGDLAARLPAGFGQVRASLTDPVPHGLLRMSAGQLRVQLAGLGEARPHLDGLDPAGQVAGRDGVPARPMLLRSVGELPAGMRRITAVLDDVGAGVAAIDVRAVARLLATGVELTAARVGAAGQGRVAGALTAGVPGLRRLASANVATLSAPDPRLAVLTTEVAGQLRRLTDGGGADVVASAVGWVRQVPAVAAALRRAVEAAGYQGRLMTRPGEDSRGAARLLLWLPVRPDRVEDHPLVVELRATVEALTAARGVLAPDHRPDVTGVVAAATELRDALLRRGDASPPVVSPRPVHPAQRLHPGAPGPRPGR